MSKPTLAVSVLVLASFGSALLADTRLVRESEARTPEEELAGFTVPEGFEIQLFASEPMINKPINLAFDARGRLWVSSTVEYPYSADKARWSDPQGTRVRDSRDAIKILEDTDGDGRADKVTDFADGLNIPTGVLPWHKPEHHSGCIAWSIPNIWYLADTTGDGKADLREILFGPLGYEKDTHGMCSSFRLGLDGWVYATHGFNNTSTFKVLPRNRRNTEHESTSPLELHSGNVFRFRPDGSAVELWSAGQVNPFGLAWDRYGNLYSADCHSSPVYQLLRGAHYPSFDKPHDGLGFAPVICQHTHGSTGICGIVYIDGGVWGPEWDDRVFLGNVVTSRINHDHITFSGATPTANEQPDFLTSDDPWFRPVDLTLGPDSALYIADFYNRIIGHYEVPLDHPGRDKERGRIWRVSRSQTEALTVFKDEWSYSPHDLATPNLTERHLMLQAIKTKHPEKPFFLTSPGYKTTIMRANWWWFDVNRKFNRSNLRGTDWAAIFGKPGTGIPEADLVEVLRQATEFGYESWIGELGILRALDRDQPRVRLAAAGVMQAHPSLPWIKPLLAALSQTPADDPLLEHALRLALRDTLKIPDAFAALPAEADSQITQVALAVPTADSAAYLFEHGDLTQPEVQVHLARNARPESLPAIIQSLRQLPADPTPVIESLFNGLLERGLPPLPDLLAWAQDTAAHLIEQDQTAPKSDWQTVPQANPQPAWSLVARKLADGTEIPTLQSMAKGGGAEESRTGILRSKTFPAPAKLSFQLCGHRGPPKKTTHDKNLVRLVNAQGKTLRRAFPPRSDDLQLIEWDLAAIAGKAVRLEIVDGDAGKAYAWLGISGITPSVVTVESFGAENETRQALTKLAVLLRTTAPLALRDQLAPFLPPSPAAPPAQVSPELRAELDHLIATRAAAYQKAAPDLANGAAVFSAQCASCHQIAGQGGLLGPQLDGIGARGIERLCEDILDPNRNVDAHFHLHLIIRKDGSTLSGFVKAEVGQVLIIADAAGAETRVPKSDIESDKALPFSLMPPTFGQTLSESDFIDLLGWLIAR